MKNSFPDRRLIGTVCAALLGTSLTTPILGRAAYAAITEGATPRYVPAQTRVVLLPMVNESGEKDRKQRADQVATGQKELEKQFQSRGFNIVGSLSVDKALADLKIDLADEENHNRAALYKIGSALNADVVAFVVITNVDQKRVQRPFGDDDHQLETRANIKVWLLDVKRQEAILSAVRQEAQAKNVLFASFDSGARLIRKSVEGAVRDSLKEVLSSYPVVSK